MVCRVIGELCTVVKDLIYACIGALIEKQVSCEVLEHVLGLGMQFHVYKESGKVTRTIYRGAYQFGAILQAGIFSVLPILVQFSLILCYFAIEYAWIYSAITVSAVSTYCLCTFLVTRHRTKIKQLIKHSDNNFNQRATEALTNIETIKLFHTTKLEIAGYSAAYTGFVSQTIRFYNAVFAMNVGQQFAMTLGTLCVLVKMAWEVESGTQSVGDFVLMNTYLIQLFAPMASLSSYYKVLVTAWVDVEAIMCLLEHRSEVEDVAGAVDIGKAQGQLEFRNVSFSYTPDASLTLHNLSFTLPPGHTLAIVGSSGAGKSTISKLLFRLYNPTHGQVFLDNYDIRHVTMESLLRNMSIVSQECCLFNHTLGYNLAYPILKDPVTDSYRNYMERVMQAAKRAQLDTFISSLEDGYDTLVGERGVRLSGGQKQRVSLARSIIKNPVLLCLDEATSSLDSHTETHIFHTITEIAKTCTTVIISHRMSTIQHADLILVLEAGEIKETGSHKSLMELQGLYHSFVMRQNHQKPEEK